MQVGGSDQSDQERTTWESRIIDGASRLVSVTRFVRSGFSGSFGQFEIQMTVI